MPAHHKHLSGSNIMAKLRGFVFRVMLLCMGMASGLNVHWCPKQCDCYTQYSTVDCSARGLTKLPRFSNLTQRLYLEENQIDHIPEDGFNNLPLLTNIDMHNNRLKSIDTASFCGLPRLEELRVSGNEIHNVKVSPECVAPHVRELNLEGNKLLHPPTNISLFAPNMLTFNLSYNQIGSAFLDSSYSDMAMFHTIDFRGNHIHEIGIDDFSAVAKSLKRLNLLDCGLVYFDPEGFTNLQNLTHLYLPRNLLPSDNLIEAFNHLGNQSQLQLLDLSDMYLPNLTVSMLGMFTQLTSLDVSDSSVEYIEPALWTALPNLEYLYLESNKLKSLENLTALKKLRYLYLHDNLITDIEVRSLKRLEWIDLSHNHIKTLPKGWLESSEVLFKVNLSSNWISSIDDDAFHVISLHDMDLSHNNLRSLHSFGHIKLSNMYVSRNLISSISADAFHQLDTTLEELDLSYNNLSTFPHHTFHDFLSLQRLNLAHNHLGHSLATGQGGQGGLFPALRHLQVLDLSYNGIRQLPHQHLQHLHHLTTLYLQGNEITDLAELSLRDVKNLAKLVVSNNELTTIEPAVMVSLGYLQLVDLSNNPYDCACHLLHYLHWLNNTLVTVLWNDVPQRYRCSSPATMRGQYIQNYRPHVEDCLQYEHFHFLQDNLAIVGIIVACLFVFGLVVSIVLYYGQICQRIKSLQYRWQIRYREVSGVEIAGEHLDDPKV